MVNTELDSHVPLIRPLFPVTTLIFVHRYLLEWKRFLRTSIVDIALLSFALMTPVGNKLSVMTVGDGPLDFSYP